VTQHMSEQWSQPIVLLNRAGAGGNIGAETVARAVPDGYTLLVGSTALAISPSLYKNMSYDPLKDLAPITQLVVTPNLLVVHPAVPAHSVRELIALAKARPGKLRSASAGAGSSNHLALLLFNSLAGVEIAHIPYKGAAPAVTDVLGGHVEMTFVPIPAALPLVQAGKLRALGISTARRSSALPEVPTIAEAGVAGYEAGSWTALLAPAATPRPIVNRIHAAAADSLRSPAVKEVLAKMGAEPVGNTPDEFSRILREETVKWGKVIQAAGGKLD
jgi:tripartite-type tricarboxylate transporter receptor subunit TctC